MQHAPYSDGKASVTLNSPIYHITTHQDYTTEPLSKYITQLAIPYASLVTNLKDAIPPLKYPNPTSISSQHAKSYPLPPPY